MPTPKDVGLPSKDNIHLPLLKVLNDAGGTLSSHDAIEQVKMLYPQLAPEDIASRLDSGGNRLVNRIRWAKQDLVLKGEIERSKGGIWKITPQGKSKLQADWSSWNPEYDRIPTSSSGSSTSATTQITGQVISSIGSPLERLEQVRREYLGHVESDILERLHGIDAGDFEGIIAELLEKLGYGSREDGTIRVTGRSGDRGIDGECAMDRLGTYKVMFQAKRWTNTVTPDDVRGFIGALNVKRVEQGIFVTTSDFTRQAREEAQQSGKVKLIDGKELARLMVEAGLGVTKKPLDLPVVDEDYFA
jgi:restriction system protein